MKAAAERLKKKLPINRNHVIDQLKQVRRDIDAYLDELEAKSTDELDRNIVDKIKTIEEQINICKASSSSLGTSKSDIEKTISVGNKEEKFIAINRATKQTKQYCNLLLELNRELADMSMNFEPNTMMPDMFKTLGNLSFEASKVTNVFTEANPIYTGEIKVKSEGNSDPLVTSCDMLQDGRKLLLDAGNNTLQLYDTHNSFVSETRLPVEGDDNCLSFVLHGHNEALIVTAKHRLLNVVVGDNLLAHLSEIKSEHGISLMTKYNDGFLCVLGDNDHYDICVIDKNMEKIVKPVMQDDGSRMPWFQL